jgi:hypothetical protein
MYLINTTDSVGVGLDTAAANVQLLKLVQEYLSLKHTDKQLVTTDSVGVRLDTKA